MINSVGSQLQAMRRLPALALALAAMLVATLLLGQASASHGRYLHLSWQSLGGNEVEFTYVGVFRRDSPAYSGTGSADDGYPVTGDTFLETQASGAGTQLCFGDNECTDVLTFIVTSYDIDNNFVIARAYDPDTEQARIRYTYADAGPYTAYSQECCRTLSDHDPDGNPNNFHWNNPSLNYRVETLVEPGSGVRSPRTDLEPIVTCPLDGECSFDIDNAVLPGRPGTTLRYRLADDQEATGGQAFTHPAGDFEAEVDEQTGIYTWNTVGAEFNPDYRNNLYSTQVIIEEIDADSEVVGKAGVDFFIRLTDAEGDPPEFEASEAAEEPVATTPGRPIHIFVSAGRGEPANGAALLEENEETITLNVQALPGGAEMDPPLPISGVPPVSSTFTWEPGADQLGEELVTFTATDDETGQVGRLTYTLNVTYDALVVEEGPNPPAATFSADMGDSDVAMMQYGASVPSESSTDVTIETLTFDTDELQGVSTINVYTDPAGDGTPGDLVASTTQFDAGDEQVTMTLTDPFLMEPGDSQVFVVTYDLGTAGASSATQPLIALGLLPLALFGLGLVRRSRGLTVVAAAFTIMLLAACAADVAPEPIESTISLTEVGTVEAEATMVGLPLEGSTVTIRR